MTEITTSHDPRDWREAFETSEPGPELDRIRARVASARQRGENDAIVAVVLDEASGWRVRALQAEADAARKGLALAAVSRRLGMLTETIESECDPIDGLCHEHDLTDDGRCALLADLEAMGAAIRGDS